MKAGKEHRVPLSAAAMAIVESMAEIREGEFVFPGGKAGQPLSNMAFLMLLRRMGRDDLTAHGFRSTFRDWAGDRDGAGAYGGRQGGGGVPAWRRLPEAAVAGRGMGEILRRGERGSRGTRGRDERPSAASQAPQRSGLSRCQPPRRDRPKRKWAGRDNGLTFNFIEMPSMAWQTDRSRSIAVCCSGKHDHRTRSHRACNRGDFSCERVSDLLGR